MCFYLNRELQPTANAAKSKPKQDNSQSKSQTLPPKSKSKPGTPKSKSEGSQTPPNVSNKATGLAQDLSMLGLEEDRAKMDNSPVPAMSMKQAELVEKIKKEEESQEKKGVSLVVVGKFLLNA
jgi:elongation factor 1 alpha-like protein